LDRIDLAAPKSGILAMTMTAARDCAPYGIRVNCLALGTVDSKRKVTRLHEKLRGAFAAKIPARRWSGADEAAKPICFQLSGAASCVTGQRLPAYGGHPMNA